MAWWHKEPWHQPVWYWSSSHQLFQLQLLKDQSKSHRQPSALNCKPGILSVLDIIVRGIIPQCYRIASHVCWLIVDRALVLWYSCRFHLFVSLRLHLSSILLSKYVLKEIFGMSWLFCYISSDSHRSENICLNDVGNDYFWYQISINAGGLATCTNADLSYRWHDHHDDSFDWCCKY